MKRNKVLMIIILAVVAINVLAVEPVAAQGNKSPANVGANLSCANPSRGEEWKCSQIERQILASTVRLVWDVQTRDEDGTGYTGAGSTGYATIKEGRYLVTHNHTNVTSLSDPKDGEIVQVSVYKADGGLIWEGPLAAITIVVEDAETLVLDFGIYRGEGMLASLGLSSAEFQAWESLPLQAGMEVAQIDWDGETAHVDWVTIDDVITDSGTPRLELDNFVMKGASGGGVFWNGYHIANNWSQATTYDGQSGAVARQYSVAALNSTQAASAVVADADGLVASEGGLAAGNVP